MRIRGTGVKRRAIHWFVRTHPRAARHLAKACARAHAMLFRRHDPPWVLMHMLTLLNHRVPVEASLYNGMKIVVLWNDYVGGHIVRDGCYERHSVAVIERLLEPGMMFVDVGAHVGQYTLVASPIVGSTGGVHAFEPDPDTFSLLAGNVATNHLRNVHANRAALFSEETKKALFLSSVVDVGSNSLALPVRPAGESCEVECLTLDGYLRAKGVRRVDVMKIDVEGAEYHVLHGATDQLAGNEKPVILIEFEEERQIAFGYSCAKLADLLRSYGYSLIRIGKDSLDEYVASAHDERSFNILAVPSYRRDRVLALLQRGTGG